MDRFDQRLFPQHEDADSMSADLLQLLTGMGIRSEYAQQAIAQVDPTLPNAAELCFHWMEEHPDSAPQMTDEEKKFVALVEPLTGMGFAREDAVAGLRVADNDLHRAVLWILQRKHDELKLSIEDEQKQLKLMEAAETPGRPDDDHYTTPLPSDHGVPLSSLISSSSMSPDSKGAHNSAAIQAVHAAAARQSDRQASSEEIKQLTAQIVSLQELVLTYQNKYLQLKRRNRKTHEDELSAPPIPPRAPPSPRTQTTTTAAAAAVSSPARRTDHKPAHRGIQVAAPVRKVSNVAKDSMYGNREKAKAVQCTPQLEPKSQVKSTDDVVEQGESFRPGSGRQRARSQGRPTVRLEEHYPTDDDRSSGRQSKFTEQSQKDRFVKKPSDKPARVMFEDKPKAIIDRSKKL